ncbi:hypothetical protein RGQ29_006661 [Quercus rubra]|uniref:Uncharacterized protein n=1 Tax=Quercus rubra TaxID=3512 RepID=A0AAN7IC58_QUERU|nr:hypothetical protein RGQ29_006661 [Quercus rubra]
MVPKATKHQPLRIVQLKLNPCRCSWMGLRLLLLLVFLVAVASSSSNTSKIVKTLPGYTGELPFTLETGYIGVGDNETVQVFYYFVESERSPSRDPLLLWMSGGPGCSGLAGLLFESGPVTFKLGDYNGSLPTLQDNPFAWTQSLNIIYMDGPVGTGFSYSESLDGYITGDYKFLAQTYEFLQKWLNEHPQFLENQLMLVLNRNEAGIVPMINLKGYVLQNPATDSFIDANTRIPYAHRLSLISDQLYESAKISCNGNYVDIDASNYQCSSDVDAMDELTSDINLLNILEPSCSDGIPEPNEPNEDAESVRRSLSEKSSNAHWCRSYNHMLCSVWANNKGVQEALGVRPGTKTSWQYCNSSLAYTEEVTSVVGYHQNLTKADLRALIYSGDHDMSVSHIGTQEWINSLNLSTDESWRVWSVNGQTVGYTKKLIGDTFTLNFATVKGAGHIAAEYRVKECAAMIDRWMAYFPI